MIDVSEFEGHTPSPWEQGDPTRSPQEFYSYNEVLKRNIDCSNRTKVIASANHNFPEQAEIDARLIAAAPELLKELILAREEIVYLRKSIEWHCDLRMKENFKDGDGFGQSDSVSTLCGKIPYFEDDVTKEYLDSMGYKYCPFCGKEILLHRDSVEIGDDDFMEEEDY